MQKFFSCLVALFLSTAMSTAQTPELFDKLTFKNNDQTLPYRLLKPVNPGALERFPLIIFLHGAGERGSDNETQLKHIKDLVLDPKKRGKYPCYVLAPQCPKGEWWAMADRDGTISDKPTQPTSLLLALVEKMLLDFPIDASRIYITGVSMGGYGTWDLLARFPEKFAAAVPVCGGGDPKTVARFKHVPIWAFHGSKDTVVTPQQSRMMIQALQREGSRPGYTEYPDIEHNSWVQAYQEPHLLPWLFKQQNNVQTAK